MSLDDLHARNFQGLIVAGVDEVGRGPLAGPVVAAAVVVPEAMRAALLAVAGDSKVLSAKTRLKVAEMVHAGCGVGIGEASVHEIDTVNIRNATFLAMRRALEQVEHQAVVVDGNAKITELSVPQVCVVGGDRVELAVACASIVAKVYRDELMAKLGESYPAYGWAKNAGYGTATHMQGLLSEGVCEHHRRSFAPIKDMIGMGAEEERASHAVAA
ncbi:MAG: ribonuclease HII [Pseudomonas fluorescens]|nr:MAG: ribonuclease HII [Pseudomonas fluorescens]